ncbi:MAG: AtpZ/AtpI family protein [Reichenbachiella sp.]
MLAFILLGVWGGYKLDAYMETDNGIYTIALSMLSIVGSIIYVIRKLPKA